MITTELKAKKQSVVYVQTGIFFKGLSYLLDGSLGLK